MEIVKDGQKQERTMNDINTDYARVCRDHGDRAYKIERMTEEMADMRRQMRALDDEAIKLSQAKKSDAPAPAAEAAAEPMPEPVA